MHCCHGRDSNPPLRCRKPRLSSVDLASQLNDDATVRLDVALLRMQLPPDGGDRFNVVAVIGKREAKTAANGRTFLRWRLTGAALSTLLPNLPPRSRSGVQEARALISQLVPRE